VLNKENLLKRKKALRALLTNYMKKFHEQFLLTKKIKNFDYKLEGCWHSSFDIESVPDISAAALPAKPEKHKKRVYQRLAEMDQNSRKNATKYDKLVEKLVQRTNQKRNRGKMEEEGKGEAESLEEMILRTVKAKEQEMEARRRAKQNSGGRTAQVVNLVRVANTLKMYYGSRKVKNMFLVKVVDYVYKANRMNLLGKDQIRRIIEEIASGACEWLKIVENPSGLILRMDKGVKYSDVLSWLKKGKEQH
jgi:hypothetical protein